MNRDLPQTYAQRGHCTTVHCGSTLEKTYFKASIAALPARGDEAQNALSALRQRTPPRAYRLDSAVVGYVALGLNRKPRFFPPKRPAIASVEMWIHQLLTLI